MVCTNVIWIIMVIIIVIILKTLQEYTLIEDSLGVASEHNVTSKFKDFFVHELIA